MAMVMTAAVTVGAERTDLYLSALQGKRVALLSNHTGLVNGGKEHTLDMLLRNGVNVTTIYSPEHGFRGTADAGGYSLEDGTPLILSEKDQKWPVLSAGM